MKVYFCGSIRGDRSRLTTFRFMVQKMQSLGHEVLTTHIIADNPQETEKRMTAQEVYERDINVFLPQADIVVAEVSGPSFGVGFEVGYTVAKGEKPVSLFYEKQLAENDLLSSLARGCTAGTCTIVAYGTHEDIAKALERIFHNYHGSGTKGVS